MSLVVPLEKSLFCTLSAIRGGVVAVSAAASQMGGLEALMWLNPKRKGNQKNSIHDLTMSDFQSGMRFCIPIVCMYTIAVHIYVCVLESPTRLHAYMMVFKA